MDTRQLESLFLKHSIILVLHSYEPLPSQYKDCPVLSLGFTLPSFPFLYCVLQVPIVDILKMLSCFFVVISISLLLHSILVYLALYSHIIVVSILLYMLFQQ